jgi:pyrroline-5-carboxylate reductase
MNVPAFLKVLFVGGGNMANAMIGGLLARGISPASIGVVELRPEARDELSRRYGVATFGSVAAAPVGGAGTLVLAVKPQQLRAVAAEIGPLLKDAVVLSIAAGIRVADLSRWLGGYAKVVRSMPNTPALIQCGVTGLFAPVGVDAAARRQAEDIVATIGSSFWVDDEALMDSVTAVSGSGPAYVFYFMEALQQAALSFGFTPEAARQMALETVLGAAKLAAAGGEGFEVLRERVTSKGGTTYAALEAMRAAKVAEGIVVGMQAAQARGRELGEQLGKDA